MSTLEGLCADSYLSIDELIPVPADVTGYPQTIRRQPPADPAPFNHSTSPSCEDDFNINPRLILAKKA
jgi:hypothetical protein